MRRLAVALAAVAGIVGGLWLAGRATGLVGSCDTRTRWRQDLAADLAVSVQETACGGLARDATMRVLARTPSGTTTLLRYAPTAERLPVVVLDAQGTLHIDAGAASDVLEQADRAGLHPVSIAISLMRFD